jgi:hypothetical protein
MKLTYLESRPFEVHKSKKARVTSRIEQVSSFGILLHPWGANEMIGYKCHCDFRHNSGTTLKPLLS